jgi:PTS system glucitol/sorbitol-specific IIC component
MALPALLAIDAQIGGDFVPAGLALGEEEPETINAGVPPVLFTRLITVPVAVVAAYFFCFGFN